MSHFYSLIIIVKRLYMFSFVYVVVIVVACFSCAAVIFLMPEIEGSSVGMKTGFFDFKQFFLLSRGKTFHALSFFLCEKMLVHRTAVAALVYSSCERIFFLNTNDSNMIHARCENKRGKNPCFCF